MRNHIEDLLSEGINFQDEQFVQAVLNYLEIEFRKLCLSLLHEATESNINLKSMYTEIVGLQRPSWGCWNGLLLGMLKLRRTILNTGSIQQREIVNKSKELAWISIRIEILEDICDQLFGEKWSNISGQPIEKNNKSSLKARVLLSIPIQIRNRAAHDNVQDKNWWSDVRYVLGFILNWYLGSGIREHFSNINSGEPWIFASDGEVWLYNGIDIKGEESLVFYVSETGKSKVDNHRAGEVMAAFKKILGEENLQEANFKRLMNNLAPEELKGFLLGGYIVGEKDGEGGFAEVFKGIQLSTGRKVALKILKPGLSSIDRARFLQEAEYLSRFDHPNIAKIYEQNEQPWRKSQLYDLSEEEWFSNFKKNHGNILTYIAMEWIDGNTLDSIYLDMRQDRKNCSEKEIAEWFMESAEALEAINNANLIHRDISPRNIMITANGTIKLMDFGISRTQFEERTIMTSHGKLLGSEPYMSPEQLDYLRAKSEIGPRSDIYSLGSTFYELFTRTRLYNHDNNEISIATASEMKKRGERPKAPIMINKSISWEISTILMGCLEYEPADRYESAQKLKKDINNYLNNRPIEYKHPSIIRRIQLMYRRNRVITNISVAFLILIIISTTIYINSLGNEMSKTKAQRDLATKNGVEAIKQRGEAIKNKDNAVKQAKIAQIQRKEAIKQKNNAIGQTRIAQIQRKEAIKQKNNAIGQTKIAHTQRAEAIKQTKIAQTQRIEAIKQKKNAIKQEEIAKDQRDKANQESIIAKQQRDKALTNQSLFLSDVSKTQTDMGNAENGMLIGVEALPSNFTNLDRPYVPQAEAALYYAMENYRNKVELQGHYEGILSMNFSHNGNYLVTTSSDYTTCVWDTVSNHRKWLFNRVNHGDVNYAEFSSNDKYLVTASSDGTAIIWDIATGKKISVLNIKNSIQYAFFNYTGKRVFILCNNGDVTVWDFIKGVKTAEMHDMVGVDYRFKISSDRKNAVFITKEGNIVFVDSNSCQKLVNKNYSGTANSDNIFLSPDSNYIWIGKKDKTVDLIDVSNGRSVNTFTPSISEIKKVTLSPDGKIAVIVLKNDTVCLYDVAKNTLGKEINVNGYILWDQCRFSQDSKSICILSENGQIEIWDTEFGNRTLLLNITCDFDSKLLLSPDNKIICLTSKNKNKDNRGIVSVWHLDKSEIYVKTNELTYENKNVSLAILSQMGNKAAVAIKLTQDSAIELLETSNCTKISKLKGIEGTVTDMKFSKDETKLYAITNSGKFYLWNLNNNLDKEKYRRFVFGDDIKFADYISNGQVVVADANGNIMFVNETNGTILSKQKINLKSGYFNNCKVSYDGRFMAVQDGVDIYLWDFTQRSIVVINKNNDINKVSNVFFSPDGSYCAVVHEAYSIEIIKLDTFSKKEILTSENTAISDILFSINNRYLVATAQAAGGFSDIATKIWEVKTCKEISQLSPPDIKIEKNYMSIRKLFFNADGKRLLGLYPDSNYYVWDTNSGVTLLGFESDGSKFTDYVANYNANVLLSFSEGCVRIRHIINSTKEAIILSHKILSVKLTKGQRKEFFIDN